MDKWERDELLSVVNDLGNNLKFEDDTKLQNGLFVASLFTP